jgi:hypothetical protein
MKPMTYVVRMKKVKDWSENINYKLTIDWSETTAPYINQYVNGEPVLHSNMTDILILFLLGHVVMLSMNKVVFE